MNQILRQMRQQKIPHEKGQSLVEFALVLAFIIIPVTFVFIETSVILYKYVTLTNAAREGARTGSIYLYMGNPDNAACVSTPNVGDPCGPDNARSAAVADSVGTTVGPLMPPPPDCNGAGSLTSCQITYGPPTAPIPDPLRSTDALTITVVHTHSVLFGAVGEQISLRSQANMRIEPSVVISP